MNLERTELNEYGELVEYSIFDNIKQVNQYGNEYWSARDLMHELGYEKWQKFEGALERARQSANLRGYNFDDYLITGAGKLLQRGNRGGTQLQADYFLTKFACYLVAMNADPRKAKVSEAQHYFAESTILKEREDFLFREEVISSIRRMENKIDSIKKDTNELKQVYTRL